MYLLKIYSNINQLFLTYFAKTFMIIVVYFFEIDCFMQLHNAHTTTQLHFTTSIHKFNFVQLFFLNFVSRVTSHFKSKFISKLNSPTSNPNVSLHLQKNINKIHINTIKINHNHTQNIKKRKIKHNHTQQ